MERHSPKTARFVVGSSAEVTVYTSDLAPADVDISVFNSGEVVAKFRIQGNADYIPVAPGRGLTVNSHQSIYATTDSGTTTVITATGVRAWNSGVSSTGAVTKSELSALGAALTQKDAILSLLQQSRLTNEYLSLLTDTRLHERDIPSDA